MHGNDNRRQLIIMIIIASRDDDDDDDESYFVSCINIGNYVRVQHRLHIQVKKVRRFEVHSNCATADRRK